MRGFDEDETEAAGSHGIDADCNSAARTRPAARERMKRLLLFLALTVPLAAQDVPRTADNPAAITVVVLDDVLDSGITAAFVAKTLTERGASSTSIAVLVEKNIERQLVPHADYAAFSAGEEWLVGMGMDDPATALEAYRWSEYIYEIS